MNGGDTKPPWEGVPALGEGQIPLPPKIFGVLSLIFGVIPPLKELGVPKIPPKKGKKFHFFKGGDNSQLVKLRGGSRPDPLVPKIGILQHF